jgi:predicted DCC family thiol-disulfide oxidoreductase YuxK
MPASAGAARTVVLVEGGRISVKSEAALRIALKLGWPWKALYGLSIIPAPLRDLLYDVVAAHRYAWFGRRRTCMVPPGEWKDRFIDDTGGTF